MERQASAWAGRVRVTCIALALASGGAALAMDLEQAWRAAVVNDAQLRAARASAEANRERVPLAESQLRPQVGLSMNRSRNELDQESPGLGGEPFRQHLIYGSGTDSLSVRQPLFRRQLSARLAQARALVANGDAVLEQEEQLLVMRLTQAYLEALQAEEQLRLVLVQRAAYAAQLDAARRGFVAGSGTRTDIDEAQSRLDLNTAQELEARQSVDYARRQLAQIVGEPVTELAPIDVDRLPLAMPDPPRLEAWLDRAESSSPEIRAAAAQVEAAREELERARAGHSPTLDVVAQLSRSDSDNPTRVHTRFRQKTVGLELYVPLYQGGMVDSEVRRALAELEHNESVLHGTRLDLATRMHREFRGVTEGIPKVRAMEQAVRSSEQLVISSRRAQQAGSRTVVDILNAEQQLGTARRDLAQARFTYVLAVVRLRALAGELREASIAEVNGWLAPVRR